MMETIGQVVGIVGAFLCFLAYNPGPAKKDSRK